VEQRSRGRRRCWQLGPDCQRAKRAARAERGDAGACAGRAGWAAARSWRVSRGAGRTGPSGAAWPRWAAAGQAGEVGFGVVPGEGKRPGEEWVWAGLGREVGCRLGFVWVRFGCGFALGFYFSISISFLCLTQAQLI